MGSDETQPSWRHHGNVIQARPLAARRAPGTRTWRGKAGTVERSQGCLGRATGQRGKPSLEMPPVEQEHQTTGPAVPRSFERKNQIATSALGRRAQGPSADSRHKHQPKSQFHSLGAGTATAHVVLPRTAVPGQQAAVAEQLHEQQRPLDRADLVRQLHWPSRAETCARIAAACIQHLVHRTCAGIFHPYESLPDAFSAQ